MTSPKSTCSWLTAVRSGLLGLSTTHGIPVYCGDERKRDSGLLPENSLMTVSRRRSLECLLELPKLTPVQEKWISCSSCRQRLQSGPAPLACSATGAGGCWLLCMSRERWGLGLLYLLLFDLLLRQVQRPT